jgi:DNA-binding MarR family transcriptional regulator
MKARSVRTPSNGRGTTPTSARGSEAEPIIDALMAGAQVFSNAIARSLSAVDGLVTLQQLRVLVVAEERGVLGLADVSELLGVHASNATRLVDRLVTAGLIDRTQDPSDRRQLRLTPTREGTRVVEKVMNQRRAAFTRLLAGMPIDEQRDLGKSMLALVQANQRVVDDASATAI